MSQVAAQLAENFGADVGNAKLAGILHDCAREISSTNLLKLAETFGIVVSDVEICETAVITRASRGVVSNGGIWGRGY